MKLFALLQTIVVLLAICCVPARGATVAVLQDEQARTQGLGERVQVQLAESDQIRLVERDRLQAVAAEQVLAAVIGSHDDRERLGNLVAADVLVLLTVDGSRVRAVVCDTSLGVTLQDVTYTTAVAEPGGEEVTKALAAETRATIARFAGGVRQVVAVTDFACRDLTFERTFLQRDYAEVLRAAFRQVPGVALVAVDEARAIAQEREVAGVQQGRRIVPIFVEGEYRTSSPVSLAAAADAKPTVRLTVRARDAARTLYDKTYESLPLDAAGAKLLEAFAAGLAPLCGNGDGAAAPRPAGIDAQGQFDLLTQRAQVFFDLGEFRRAAALREAALLLKPDADAQRVQLVREYARRNSRPVEQSQWPKGAKAAPGDPFWMSVCEQVVGDWKRSLQHCEYLVRNRRLCREEATDLTYNAVRGILGVRGVGGGGPQMMAECEGVKKDFVREVFARIASLDPATREQRQRLSGALDCYHFLFDTALLRCEGNFYAVDDLNLLSELLTERLPDDMWPSYQLNFFFGHVGQGLREKSSAYRFTETEYVAFLDKLIASDRPLVRIYGRYGKLCFRRRAKQEATPELVAEAKAILDAAEAMKFSKSEYSYYLGQLRDELTWVSRDVNPPAVAKPGRPAPKREIAQARVKLEPIELTLESKLRTEKTFAPDVRWRAPGGWGAANRYRTMGAGLDVFWSRGAVLFMREPGKVVEVLADEKLDVNDVVTDGQFVWVAASYDRGLYVLDRSGKVLTQIDQIHGGLPPTNAYGAPLLHPLGPGRVLMTGSFGNEQRGWIALVEYDVKTGAAKVDVFHEGTKVWDYKARDNYKNPDPAMCFVPEVICEHVTPAGKRLVYIARRYAPLVVDVEQRKVWVYPIKDLNKDYFPRNEGTAEAFASIDGVLWVAGSQDDVTSYQLDEGSGLFRWVRKRQSWHYGNAREGTLVRVGDWLYYCGAGKWRRIDVKNGREQVLVDDPRALPSYGSGNGWMLANSSHYGLVAFNYGKLYRVTLDSPDEK